MFEKIIQHTQKYILVKRLCKPKCGRNLCIIGSFLCKSCVRCENGFLNKPYLITIVFLQLNISGFEIHQNLKQTDFKNISSYLIITSAYDLNGEDTCLMYTFSNLKTGLGKSTLKSFGCYSCVL